MLPSAVAPLGQARTEVRLVPVLARVLLPVSLRASPRLPSEPPLYRRENFGILPAPSFEVRAGPVVTALAYGPALVAQPESDLAVGLANSRATGLPGEAREPELPRFPVVREDATQQPIEPLRRLRPPPTATASATRPFAAARAR